MVSIRWASERSNMMFLPPALRPDLSLSLGTVTVEAIPDELKCQTMHVFCLSRSVVYTGRPDTESRCMSLKAVALSDQIADHLAGQIIHGTLPPGTRLHENELAKIGRASCRERVKNRRGPGRIKRKEQ